MDAEGSVLLSLTKFGETSSPQRTGNVLSDRSSTNAVSGRTFLFDANLRTVSGHERDGSVLPFLSDGPIRLDPQGPLWGVSSSLGAVAADDAGGAWFTYFDTVPVSNPALRVVYLNATGELTRSYEVRSEDLDWTDIRANAVLAGSDVVAVTATPETVYAFEITDVGPFERTVVVEGLDWQHDIRDMAMLEWQGDKWLAYTEQKWGSYFRVLKVAPGCVYSAPRPDTG